MSKKFIGRRVITSGANIGAKRKVSWACLDCCVVTYARLEKVEGRTTKKKLHRNCDICGAEDRVVFFDSSREYKRWCELRNWERAGVIKDLKYHVKYDLHAQGGVKLGVYEVDSTHITLHNEPFIEDVKGRAMDPVSQWKIRHFEAEYGMQVNLF